MIVGEYEKMPARNNWHYVTITYNSLNSVYLWKNKANVEWKLYPTENENELRVDKSVSYYDSANWKTAEVTNEGIYGPHGEFYTRMNSNVFKDEYKSVNVG